MDITTRNFFSLLRAGAFGTDEQIEPMSAWKWRQVYRRALMHDVAALLWDGVDKCRGQFFMQHLPASLVQSWQEHTRQTEEAARLQAQAARELMDTYSLLHVRPMLMLGPTVAALYDEPLHRVAGAIRVYFPFDTQGQKADEWARERGGQVSEVAGGTLTFSYSGLLAENHHRLHRLTNQLHQHTLQSIVQQHIRQTPPTYSILNGTRVETLSPTLTVLLMLLQSATSLLGDGISLKQLTDLGIFLRKQGHRVDFVTLQEYTERLRLQRSASLVASLLMGLLGFAADELPFASPRGQEDISRALGDLFRQRAAASHWYFKQEGDDVFVHAANSSALFSHMRHSARYFSYYPTESITNFFSVFSHSLSHIEE